MDVISYANIVVSGFPFQRILSLSIEHRPNEHGMAEIVGEIRPDTAQDIVRRVDERTDVEITTTAEGQPEKLFYGCVQSLAMEQENDYSRITLKLSAVSRRTDVTRKKKSFQKTTDTYKKILSEVFSADAELDVKVQDESIGKLVVQYDETGWEFAKRMASRLHAPLLADIVSSKPYIYVGMPPSQRSVPVESRSFSYGSDVSSYSAVSGAMVQDFSGEWVESDQYACIGDTISLNGKTACIRSVRAVLRDGIMHMRYEILGAADRMAGIAAPESDSRAAGRMLRGRVLEVSKDKVQVQLVDIDGDEDRKGDWWFPFSTAYSSGDGSGWYCMPEVKDEVRVIFPSGDEGDAFVASSVCACPPKDPKHKSWRAPGGKEILLTEEGMYIIGKSGKIYINLTDEAGVEILSDKGINLSAGKDINIIASDAVSVVAKNQITVGTEGAYLTLTKKSATLAADQVLIN